ncbi:MAG: hypothetical protein QXS24_05815 [Desulfurococcaceae archaeon]
MIEEYSASINLPSEVINNAKWIAEKAILVNIALGYKPEEIAAVSIYVACRRNRVPLLLKEVIRVAKTSKAKVRSLYRRIIHYLELKPPIPDPADYLVKRLAPTIKVSSDALANALEIINKAKNAGVLHGKNPSAVAAAALYLAMVNKSKKISISRLARLAGVTSVTVKNILKVITPIVKST